MLRGLAEQLIIPRNFSFGAISGKTADCLMWTPCKSEGLGCKDVTWKLLMWKRSLRDFWATVWCPELPLCHVSQSAGCGLSEPGSRTGPGFPVGAGRRVCHVFRILAGPLSGVLSHLRLPRAQQI